MALQATRTYTIDEFEAFIALPENHDRRLELIHGEIVEKTMPTDKHTDVAGWFITFFGLYALEHDIGGAGPERRIRVPGDTQNSRLPDVSMIIDPNLPYVDRGAISVMPDVIVEVKSPDDTEEEQRARATFYIANGARLVILAFPKTQSIEVYRPGEEMVVLGVEDTLSGYDVLPGFEVPLAKIFRKRRGGD